MKTYWITMCEEVGCSFQAASLSSAIHFFKLEVNKHKSIHAGLYKERPYSDEMHSRLAMPIVFFEDGRFQYAIRD